jgi:hypothetical protein
VESYPPDDSARRSGELGAAADRAISAGERIAADAAAEAARLNSQCTKVKPFALTPAVMEQITSLDGSVVIDPDGVCHAMGAILDGSVSARGNRVRGGRYNSALMYVDSCPFPSLIVVVSQDGMINLVYRESLQVRS